eukprot:7223497-Pyramimonas_sp.AAC.1
MCIRDSALGPSMDLRELRGSEARASRIAMRRKFDAGGDFDLVPGRGLGGPIIQLRVLLCLQSNS